VISINVDISKDFNLFWY